MSYYDPQQTYDFEDTPRFWEQQEMEKRLIEEDRSKYDEWK